MIEIIDNKNCCGCTACYSICPQCAIEMRPDFLGFLYPVVDYTKCVKCGLCINVCQFKKDYFRYDNFSQPKAYSIRLKEKAQLSRSQSGGAFFQMANFIIQGGGVVYGAAFDSNWKVSHVKATNHIELESLRMSKYVQSDLKDIFHKVRKDLKQGITVLFSGTSCQVAGLKSYIPKKEHINLICVDIICHGVPSPKIWDDYIEYLQYKHNSKIIKACFRDKRFGWHGAKESFMFANGREVFSQTSNRLYFSGYTMRESCSHCHYTNTERVGDITVGDHWGLPSDSPFEKDALGVSLVLVNSNKGNNLLNNILYKFHYEEVALKNCLQPQLKYPSELNPAYSSFVLDYKTEGFLYVAKKYGDLGIRWKVKVLYTSLKKKLQTLISRFR